MENNTTKAEVLNPIFLKAGIPLAITAAGFILAKLTQRTRPIPSDHVQVDSQSQKKHQEEGTESPTSIVESNDSSEEAEEDINHYSMGSSDVHNSDVKIDKFEVESSKTRVQELEDEMKHQELILLELQNKFSNEIIARVELLEREVSSLEAEMLRLGNIGLEYLKIVKLLEISRLKNGLLKKRVKKLLKKSKQQSHLIKEQSLKIEAQEMEIHRNYEQFEVEANVRINMEAEIEELKTIVAELQNEKNELANQIDLANKTISSKIEEEEAIKASYERGVCETEQLVKERAMEAKELVYLRWCNACLRHELMRRNQEQSLRLNYGEEISDIRSDDEIDYSSRSEEHTLHRPCSKRVKIIQKLKRWMDRHERMVR